jgi:hypothetical protein
MSDPGVRFLFFVLLCFLPFLEQHRAEATPKNAVSRSADVKRVGFVAAPHDSRQNLLENSDRPSINSRVDFALPGDSEEPALLYAAKSSVPAAQVDEEPPGSPKPSLLIQMLEGREDELMLWVGIAITFFIAGWICGGNFYVRRDRNRRRKLRF